MIPDARRYVPSGMPADPVHLAREVIARCGVLGFAAAGVCEATPTTREAELRRWIGQGMHGDMDFLERYLPIMLDPARELPGVRSVIMVADLYTSRHDGPREPSATPGQPQGLIARYARGKDYHRVIKKRLHALADSFRPDHPGHKFRSFVDTAPVLEREYAARAGLGYAGKHTLLIHPKLGSFTLLGGIYTTLELSPPPEQPLVQDHCGTCTRCIDACPTDAITPNHVDATRCVSYLTIERVGPIDPSFHSGIGGWIYGCDVCQDVCPHNSPRGSDSLAPAVREDLRPRRDSFALLDVLGWTEEARRLAFSTSAMKRANLAMMKRNALITLTNTILAAGDPDGSLSLAIRRISERPGEDELVRVTALQCLSRLG